MKNKTLGLSLIIIVSILFSVISDASNLSGTGGGGGSGSTSVVIGTLDGNTTSANGASVTGGSTIFMQSASATRPGLVNTTTQTFAGAKTFNDGITLGVALPIASGGTGQTTANAAINGLVPSQTSNVGKYLTTDGASISWSTVSAGVSGPGSSTDGAMATWNGTGGATLRSEAKYLVNATTGAVTQTFAGAPTTLNSLNIGTATTWSAARLVTGTSNNTPTTGYIDRYDFTFDIGSTTRNFHMSSVAPTISGSTSGLIAREHVSMIGTSSGNSAGGQFASLAGVVGNFTAMYNTNSTGLGISHYGWMNANKAVGARGLAYAGQGSSGKAVGVNGVATTTNSPSIVSAGYFVLDSNIGDGGAETDTPFPNVSGALVVNTGDVATTIPVFVGQVAGGSIFQIRGTGETIIGANGGSALHEINGLTASAAAQSLTMTNGPTAVTSANPTVYLKVKINGVNYVVPGWPIP